MLTKKTIVPKILVILGFILIICSPHTISQSNNADVSPPKETVVSEPLSPQKSDLKHAKLAAEIIKLQTETDKLEEGEGFRGWFALLLTPLGGIIIIIIGYFLNSTQREKIKQEKSLGEEKHLLEVFKELGSDDPRIRIGATAILIQRLKTNRNNSDQHVFSTIMGVLIADTKHEDKEEIQKYIADGIANALGAIMPLKKFEGEENERPVPPEENSISPLEPYDFQGTKLQNAFWRGVDARGVDFYGASLARASLRQAFLQHATLKKADLTKTVLIEANLDGANMTKAVLKETDLTNASLQGATLKDVDFTGATIKGADFTDAKFNKATKITEEQYKAATFDDKVAQNDITIIKKKQQELKKDDWHDWF